MSEKVFCINLHAKTRSSAEPFYKDLNITKIENINKYPIGNFAYRYIYGQVPDTFSSLIIRNGHIHAQLKKNC